MKEEISDNRLLNTASTLALNPLHAVLNLKVSQKLIHTLQRFEPSKQLQGAHEKRTYKNLANRIWR